MDNKTLTKLIGEKEEVIILLLAELGEHDVYSKTNDGLIYNRRMVMEGEISDKRSMAGQKGMLSRWKMKKSHNKMITRVKHDVITRSASASASASSSLKNKNLKREPPKIMLVLDEEPKRWEGITEELKALWAKTYPGCDIDIVLQEMIAYWDAQPKAKRKINWKVTIVNRLKWLQDHGGTRGNVTGGVREWLVKEKEKEKGEKLNE